MKTYEGLEECPDCSTAVVDQIKWSFGYDWFCPNCSRWFKDALRPVNDERLAG